MATNSYAENARKVQEPIFADKMSSIQIIKRSQDTLDAAAETAIAKLTQENRGKPVRKAQEDEARLSILRESMANQLLVRLKLTGTPPAPLLQPLGSDADDAAASGLILAGNPGVDAVVLARHNFEARAEVTFGAGSALLNDLQSGLADSAASSAAAARAQKLLSMSMNALESLRSSIDKEAGMSAGKKKWYRAFKRHIIRQQVEVNRVRLESSPAYHALLAEQAEKRKKAAMG